MKPFSQFLKSFEVLFYMMLTSLEGRGLIRRLRSGRENIVHIMEED